MRVRNKHLMEIDISLWLEQSNLQELSKISQERIKQTKREEMSIVSEVEHSKRYIFVRRHEERV